MNFKKSENEQGLSVEILTIYDVNGNYTPIMGGDDSNPSWKDYVNDWKEEYRSHVRLLKKVIEENYLLGTNGHEQDDWVFKFSDGECWGFSWRAWGDLMQSIINKNEGYMSYYM